MLLFHGKILFSPSVLESNINTNFSAKVGRKVGTVFIILQEILSSIFWSCLGSFDSLGKSWSHVFVHQSEFG